MNVSHTSPVLGAYIEDFSIEDNSMEENAATLRNILEQFQVIIVRNQSLEAGQLRELVKYFGPLFVHHADEGVIHADGVDEVLEMRKEPDGARLFGGSDWHADVTFRKPSAYVSALHAKVLPPLGGDTAFASTLAAYQTLSKGYQQFLEQLVAIHNYDGPDAPDHPDQVAAHPVVRIHPGSGKKGIYINRMFASRFDGMTRAESKPIIEFLDRHMTRPEFTFRHQWRAGDLVLWDNRFSLHYPINDFTGHLRLLIRCTAMEVE